MNEQFSAFLDNEASGDEADAVINGLLRDDVLRDSWSRQHWLRTTLRAHTGEIAVALDTDFSSRVMRAIGEDNAPHTVAASPVVPLSRARSTRRRRWRSMAGLAAVASATGFVLLVSNPVQRDGTGQSAAVPTVAASGNVAATQVASNGLNGDMLEQASAQPAAGVQQGPADHWSVSDPALEDELNGYLVDHNGLARGYGLAGTTPAFVRVATYGQESTQ